MYLRPVLEPPGQVQLRDSWGPGQNENSGGTPRSKLRISREQLQVIKLSVGPLGAP